LKIADTGGGKYAQVATSSGFGLLHSPLGMVPFVLSRIAKLSIERTTVAILLWLIPLLLSLIAITMIPKLTLWLPRVVGLVK
jgi:TRAP-type C4-dicarboxylate transport system permease large subunit